MLTQGAYYKAKSHENAFKRVTEVLVSHLGVTSLTTVTATVIPRPWLKLGKPHVEWKRR